MRTTMTQPSRPRRRTGNWIVIAILLAASLVGVLWVPFYARITPTLGGFPFFYWYQLMWVPIVAILGGLSYLLSRPGRTDSGAGTATPDAVRGPGSGSGEAGR
jgi:hypothetical protein